MKTTVTIDHDSTLAMKCFDTLQEAIINGKLEPGQKLKVEELKARLAVGQSPIREALSRLVSSGLVEIQGNRGFRVAAISEAEVRDLYELFFNIEMLALTQALERGDSRWEASIVAALYELGSIEKKKDPVPYAVWSAKNYAFHVALITGCNSPLLLQLRADLYRRFDRYCRLSFYHSNSNLMLNHAEHDELAQAVLRRDATKARTLMHHHIFGALEDVVYTLKLHGLI